MKYTIMYRLLSKLLVLLLLFVTSFDTVVVNGLLRLVHESAPSMGVVDRLYLARQNPNVVDNFGGIKTVTAATSSSELEYHVNVGPVSGSTAANYVYGSLFNPSGSGKSLLVKRVAVRANAVNTAVYVNLTMRRTTAASAGTQIAAANIPKKNSNSVSSIAEVRHTGVTVTFSGNTDSRILGQPTPGASGHEYSFRELVFAATDEYIVLQPGEGLAVYQEAAGDADLRVSSIFEWEEVTSTPAAQGEYLQAFPRVEVAATAGYAYNTLFNPTGTGKVAIIKRIWFGNETCDNAAVYTNNTVIKRISAATGGTSITSTSTPKKHTGSADSVLEKRRTGVTITEVGGTDARLLNVSPCGAAGQVNGWFEYNTNPADEQIILQEGQGIALISETAGDADQITRMFVEWKEVDVAGDDNPPSEGEYLWSSDEVNNVTTLGTTFFTAFNPSTSSKTMLIKQVAIRVNASSTATYSTMNFQRISTSTTGIVIASTSIPKKHTDSANSTMQIRWCGATCGTAMSPTYVGSRSVAASGLSDSGIAKALAPGAAGQPHGQREFVFDTGDPLVLRSGEGIGFYLNYLAGDIDHQVKIMIEWQEVASAPAAENKYVIDIGAMPGNTGASYNYATFFNPAASGKAAVIKQMGVRVNAVNTGTHTPLQIKRISAASAGTQIAAADIPKKDTSASNSSMEIRRTGVTATYSQSVDAQLVAVQTPAAVSSATTIGATGWVNHNFVHDEPIVLLPGEGIVLNNNAAADADHRIYWYLEWEEVATTSAPVATDEYMMTIGPVTGVTTSGYVYATLFNPVSSNKLYVLSRVGIRGNRTANGSTTAPLTLRQITAASGGTQITAANVPEKHTSSTITTAEVRTTGVTTTMVGSTDSRLFSVIAPTTTQSIAILEKEWVSGDELVLYPGEGIALYQESSAGDTNLRYYMTASWYETTVPEEPQSLTFSLSDNAIGFGTLLPGGTRYATGDAVGSGSDSAAAHTLSVSTNATDGYVVTITGNTLTCALCGGATISAIGSTAVAPSIGTEQFGLRAAVVSGTGVVSSPYASGNWALDTAAFPDTFATGAGDSATTDFGIRYMANIASDSEAGSYTANLTYIVTSTF